MSAKKENATEEVTKEVAAEKAKDEREALKAELMREIMAELAAKEAAAPKKTKEDEELAKHKAYMQEMMTIKLFKDDDKYKSDVFVGVAGKQFLIKRGVKVEVPRYVAKVIEDAEKQESHAIEYSDSLEKDYKDQELKILG